MLYTIACVQIAVFCAFFTLERMYPARIYPYTKNWAHWWVGIGVFALIWLRGVMTAWPGIPSLSAWSLSGVRDGCLLYLIYSFGNYWIHRFKHTNRFLFRYVHYLHHSPTHMDTRVAFFRHPVEIFFNTLYLILIGKIIVNATFEVIIIALTIEGCLETFHHANIRTPHRFRWMGNIIQLPEMHLVHHEYGLHRYNYTPFLWDFVFGTVYIPAHWDKRLGFANSWKTKAMVFFDY